MSPEHHNGKGEEVLASTVGANLPKGAKGSTASPRRPLPGFEGATSLASPAVIPWVSCLRQVTVESQPSAESPKPPLRARSGAASAGPSSASSPASWSPASRTARTVPRRSCRALVFRPTPYPSDTGDHRSQAISRPGDFPKCLPICPEMTSCPVAASGSSPSARSPAREMRYLAYDLLPPAEDGPLLRDSEVSVGWEVYFSGTPTWVRAEVVRRGAA